MVCINIGSETNFMSVLFTCLMMMVESKFIRIEVKRVVLENSGTVYLEYFVFISYFFENRFQFGRVKKEFGVRTIK